MHPPIYLYQYSTGRDRETCFDWPDLGIVVSLCARPLFSREIGTFHRGWAIAIFIDTIWPSTVKPGPFPVRNRRTDFDRSAGARAAVILAPPISVRTPPTLPLFSDFFFFFPHFSRSRLSDLCLFCLIPRPWFGLVIALFALLWILPSFLLLLLFL